MRLGRRADGLRLHRRQHAEDYASLYHMYYEPGHYYKSDGTSEITSEPFSPAELTKVYDGATAGVRIPSSIIRDADSEAIAITFAVQTGTPSGHIGEDGDYKYARWDWSAWAVHTLATDVGMTTFQYTEGGLSIDPSDIDRVLASVRDAGTVWRMYLYTTANAGTSWTSSQLTTTGDPDIYPSWAETTPVSMPSGYTVRSPTRTTGAPTSWAMAEDSPLEELPEGLEETDQIAISDEDIAVAADEEGFSFKAVVN